MNKLIDQHAHDFCDVVHRRLMSDIPSTEMRALFKSNLELLSQYTSRIVVVGGLPKAKGTFGDSTSVFNDLKRMVVNVDRKYKGDFGMLAAVEELTPERRLRAEADMQHAIDTANTTVGTTIEFVDIGPLMLDNRTGVSYTRFVQPYTNQIAYADQVHLNQDGVRALEGSFRTAVFNEPLCV